MRSLFLTLYLLHFVLFLHSWWHHLGVGGRIAHPTTPFDILGSAACSSRTIGLSTLDSGLTLATPASTSEDPVAPAIVPDIVADSSTIVASRSPSPVAAFLRRPPSTQGLWDVVCRHCLHAGTSPWLLASLDRWIQVLHTL